MSRANAVVDADQPSLQVGEHEMDDRQELLDDLRFAASNPGDAKSLGGGLMEMRVAHGPGYRVYFVQEGASIVILLCGGDKRRQQQDIARARKLAETFDG